MNEAPKSLLWAWREMTLTFPATALDTVSIFLLNLKKFHSDA